MRLPTQVAARGRRVLGGAGSCRLQLETMKDNRQRWWGGGVLGAFATRLSTREGIDTTLRDQRPPFKPLDWPQCYASDLKVPRSHKEAMRSGYVHLWEDSAGRDFLRIAGCGDV